MGRGYVAHAAGQEDGGRLTPGSYQPYRQDVWDRRSSLVQEFVAWEGKELDEFIVGRDAGEQLCGVAELVGLPAFRADYIVLDLVELFFERGIEEVFRHFGSVLQYAPIVVDPLPHLGAADLRGRGVFHEVEDGDGAASGEPGREVLDADGDVVAEAVHGDVAFRLLQQILGRWIYVGDLVQLVGLGHVLVEGLFGETDHAGVGDPGAVVAVLGLALLVFPHLVVGELRPLGVVGAGDLGRHPPHGVRAALVAGLYGQERVGAHERDGHGHRVTVGEEHVLLAELLDVGEDVVPPSAVQARGVFAQLVEDLVHFEGGEYGLDEDRGLDGAPGYAELVLGQLEDVVPEPGLEVALHLGQVEVRPRAVVQQRPGVVEEVQAEIEESPGDLLPIYKHVLLEEVPAAGPGQDHGRVIVQLVVLARVGVVEGDGAFDGLLHVELALQHVVPGRAVGVLEVRHPAARPRVERVYGHLAVGRSCKLNAPVLQVVRDRGYLPVPFPDVFGLGQKVRHLARVDPLLPLRPLLEEPDDPPPVLAGELRHEGDGLRRQNLFELLGDLRRKLDPFGIGARSFGHCLRLLSTASRASLL